MKLLVGNHNHKYPEEYTRVRMKETTSTNTLGFPTKDALPNEYVGERDDPHLIEMSLSGGDITDLIKLIIDNYQMLLKYLGSTTAILAAFEQLNLIVQSLIRMMKGRKLTPVQFHKMIKI